MGGITNGYMAADTIRCIFDAVSDQVPMKCIFIGFNTLQAMTGHFMGIFMAAGAQFYNFCMGSAPPHAMGKVGVKILGPIFLRVTADTAGQGFIGQRIAFAPYTVQRIVHAIVMTVLAGWQIIRKRFRIFGLSIAMYAGFVLFDHVCMRKFLKGGRLLDVAFGGTINLADIGMRYFVKPDMAVFAFYFAMHRSGKLIVIDIEDPFCSGFIEPSDTGISMT